MIPSALAEVTTLIVVATIVLQMIPQAWFRRTRYFWTAVIIEYWTKHILDWIDNRNATLALFDNNFIMLFVMLYLDSNSNLTAAILEKTFFDG